MNSPFKNPSGEQIPTPRWLQGLEADGFAIIPQVVPAATVVELMAQIDTVMQQRLADVDATSGYALRRLTKSVPAVNILARGHEIISLVEAAIGAKPLAVRSLFFDKTPGANWKVAWHQDLTIAVREKIEAPDFRAWSEKEGVIHVQPPASVLESMLTVRLPLDDCHAENGALQVLPGSHRTGRLSAEEISQWRKEVAPITLPVEAGGAILLKPLLLHASSPAAHATHRRVIHLEFASATLPHGLNWAGA